MKIKSYCLNVKTVKFSLRTRMLDLKGNFSNKTGLDIACRVCKVQVESQEHILKCDVLKGKNVGQIP